MPHFYRKERIDIFESRFYKNRQTRAWTLRNDTIFTARKSTRDFAVKLGDNTVLITCKIPAGTNSLEFYRRDSAELLFSLTERGMHDALQENDGSLKFECVRFLATAHAKSSSQSPLISGCAAPNFHHSTAYPGQKLHLVLKDHRTPIRNPFASGLEKEYFLIGSVGGKDCKLVVYLGQSHENLSEIVNLRNSGIPRPLPGFQSRSSLLALHNRLAGPHTRLLAHP